MADLTGGQLVARTLRQAGVGHVFTLCGGHILPIYDGCLTEGVGIIDVRHEQAAAHAADAYARLTRGVGVAIVVPGPETAVRFKLPFTCVIGNDGGWGQIRSPQVSFFGEARAVATSLPTTRYDLMVEALGGRGAYVTDPREIGPTLERALASDEVWCINVVLDPEAYRKSGQVSMAI